MFFTQVFLGYNNAASPVTKNRIISVITKTRYYLIEMAALSALTIMYLRGYAEDNSVTIIRAVCAYL
jgi:hypothetical protein